MFKPGVVAALLILLTFPAAAEPLRIGVITDMSGQYKDGNGPGSVLAATMAVEDFGPTVNGRPIEIVVADHQNKPDIAGAVVRRWLDQDGVEVIVEGVNSTVGLAIQAITRERGRIFLISGAGSSDLTGKACAPTGFHWTFDTVALAKGTAGAVVKAGGDTWFFMTADYAFGYAMEADARALVIAAGGKVVGGVRVPMSTADMSSYLLQAKGSGAKIIGLANAGGDLINSIKQASEFGIVAGGQKLAGLLVFISDIHSLGLQIAQGLFLTESFYWDQDDATRAFSARFVARSGGREPTMVQAGVYSGVTHYLKAVTAAQSTDGPIVAARMREIPVTDFMTHGARIRADGRVLRDFYLFEVKSPAESKGPWDYYKPIRTIPAEEAVRPEAEGGCNLNR